VQVLNIISYLILFTAIGCGKNSDSSSPIAPGTSVVAVADLAATSGFTMNTPAQADALAFLSAESELYNNQPPAPKTSPCDSAFDLIKTQANQASALINATVDVTSCKQQELSANADAGTTWTVTSATAKLYGYKTCTAGDLSFLDGKTLKDLSTKSPSDILVQHCTKSTMVFDTQNTLNANLTISGTNSTVTYATTTHEGSAGGGPCPHTGASHNSSYDDSCVYVEKSDITITTNGTTTKTEDLLKLTFNGVTDDMSSATSVWHKFGTIAVTYDNWTGSLTYSDSGVAPSYSLAPTGGAAVTGTLTVTPSALTLRNVTAFSRPDALKVKMRF